MEKKGQTGIAAGKRKGARGENLARSASAGADALSAAVPAARETGRQRRAAAINAGFPRFATIADVAAAAGCSTAVVSHVLNGSRGNIGAGAATRQRVLRAARRLAYRPHFAGRSLARQRSQTLGVYAPPCAGASLGHAYEAAILAGVESACRAAAYDILAVNIGGLESPGSCARKLAERRIDGLILFHVPHDASWVAPLCEMCTNVAAVNYYGPCAALDTINFDDVRAASLAVERLAAIGHRRLGFLGAPHPFGGPGEALRREGFVAALRRLGADGAEDWILDAGHPGIVASFALPEEEERVAAAGKLILASPRSRRPTAWVCYNDAVAVMLLKFMHGAGVAVPGEVSIVGIDDSEMCRCTFPELASVRQPLAGMGRRAAFRVIARATGNAPPERVHELVAPEWVGRGSAAAPEGERRSARRPRAAGRERTP